MHELSIGRALLGQITAVMQQRNASIVTRATVRIGALSGVEPALLRTAYEQLRRDTVAAHAELVIVPVPVHVLCESCGAQSETTANRLVCPHCSSTRTIVTSGDEMLLESVDLVFEEGTR